MFPAEGRAMQRDSEAGASLHIRETARGPMRCSRVSGKIV